MKQKFYLLWLLLATIGFMTFSGCQEEETPTTPEIALELLEAAENDFNMKVTTANADEAVYICQKEESSAPSAADLFVKGRQIQLNADGSPVNVQVKELEADTRYTVYAAARQKGADTYSQVATLQVKTTATEVPSLSAKVGVVEKDRFEVTFTATHADTFYSICLPAHEKAPKASEIQKKGTKNAIASDPVKQTFDGLDKGSEYIVYAFASNSAKDINGEIIRIEVMTDGTMDNLVVDYSAGKTSISYKIDVKDGVTYSHTYIEGWYFDYMMDLAKETEGNEFDENVVIWNLLADYGHEGSGYQEVTWNAGDDNPARHDVVRLVGGKKYYIIASLYDPVEVNWLGTAEAVEVTMKPAGESGSTVSFITEKIEPRYLQIRIEPADDVNFFFYDLYKKETYDTALGQNGQEWMENYVFEYGYTAANMYTDSWHLDPEESYVLALYGVDIAGDVFFLSQQYDMPAEKQEIVVNMEAYERQDEGCFSYESIRIDVNAGTVKEINAENVLEVFLPTATLNATLEMMGMNMETIRQHPENLASIGALPLPEDAAAALQQNKSFTSVRRELESDTEYTYLIMIPSGAQYILGEATAKTDVNADTGDAEPEYLEYLGEWVVKGKTTADYSSAMTFTIRIEQNIANRSFNIYGWGNSEETKDRPFIARYDSSSKKLFIDGHQDLGAITIDGSEYRLMFCGVVLQYGETAPVNFDGVIYDGKCNGTHLSLFPGFVDYFEITSMGYYAEKDGKYVTVPGDEYNIISFSVDKK